MNRRNFLSHLSILSASACLSFTETGTLPFSTDESEFAKHLQPVGRALEMEDYYVWCNSPIEGPDGKIHVFFSRWNAKKGMGGWINGSEIAHAVADHPEGPYQFIDVVFAPRSGYFDATTCHNPSIKKVDGKY